MQKLILTFLGIIVVLIVLIPLFLKTEETTQNSKIDLYPAYFNILATRDFDKCEKMQDPDSCYLNIAIMSTDLTLCDNIKINEKKQDCITKVEFDKETALVQKELK